MSSDPNSTKMDNREGLEHNIESIGAEELPFTLEDVILVQTPNPPPPPPPPPPLPTGIPGPPQPAAETGGFVNITFQVYGLLVSQQQVPCTVPPITTGPARLYREPGTDNQGQLRQPETNVLKIPDNVIHYLHPIGELRCVQRRDFVTPAPPPNTSSPKKRKRRAQQDDHRPYVKKPPNAFMVYLKEQRPKVIAELNITASTIINAVVGKRWKLLSNDQKARNFDQAETERRNHAKEHPEWSAKVNYGKKRRIRCSTASARVPEEEAQQANKLHMRPAESQRSSSSPSFLTEPREQPQTKLNLSNLPHQQPVPNTQASAYTPLSQVNQVSPASHMNFPAYISLASSVAPLQFQMEAPFVRDNGEELLSVLEQLDPLPITAQSQQLSPTPASLVDASPSTSLRSPVELFQHRKEPVCFAETEEDIYSLLDHLIPEPDPLSSSDSHIC